MLKLQRLGKSQLRYVYGIVVLVLVAASTMSVTAQDVQDPIVRDAMSYAADYNVPLDEAMRRLRLQDIVGDLDAALTSKEQATFAGLWIQHTPEFRVVVQFTRNGEATVQPYVKGGPLASLVEIRQANVSLLQLTAAQAQAARVVREVGVALNTDINVMENRVKVHVTNRTQLNTALRNANKHLSDSTDVVQVEKLATPAIHAGLALTNSCTSGFSVYVPATGERGITTAAHCDNSILYGGKYLPLKAEAFIREYDVQWHTAPGEPVNNLMYDGTSNRSVTGTRGRDSQAIGNYVCKYGVTTRYGCGNITTKSYSPYSNSFATYIVLHASDNANLVDPGDSGGPVFNGNTAYGIISAYANYNDAVYMAINYVPSGIGVNVLTSP